MYRIVGARLVGPGGTDAGSVAAIDHRLRVPHHVVYDNLAGRFVVSRPELHKLLWHIRFGPGGFISHVGPIVYSERLQKRGLAPKFAVSKSKPPGPPGPLPRLAGSKRSASGTSRPRNAIDCSHGNPSDPPCAACESRQLGFRTVAEVKSWSEAGRICIRDLEGGILNIIGHIRLEALGMPTSGPGTNLRASGFALLSPTQLALSGIESATMSHIATAAWTNRNVLLFNQLTQALLCLGRLVPADTWKRLVSSGAANVPARVLCNFPKGISLAPPDEASRFTLTGMDPDPEAGPGRHVIVVLPDVLGAIWALSKAVDRVFVSIVANGIGTVSPDATVAFPVMYVPKAGRSEETDTVIRGAETMTWSTLVQVLTTAPGRIVFEGCYYVAAAARLGQVPFLYLFALAIRRDYRCPSPGIRHAIYRGQPLLPPGIDPKKSAALFKQIRKLTPDFEQGRIRPVEANLQELQQTLPLLKRAVACAFPAVRHPKSAPAESEPQPE